ncbi:hypothetical protein KGF57_002053 [Candida theae]|uniref:Sulfiredoxin n=1 Tax=Candida theae TaxID=1198502 RepID=A0AAD5BFP9_9ASCO|nr:uncharacterized protein KGF57_002053 [Candida theae]KAI5959528.1 hypothetical protein KGF57_002053 [Candida theae]
MSIQTRGLKEEYVPLHEIKRPIPPVLDYQKIDAMVSTLKGIPMSSATCKIEDITVGELPPIDVFKIRHQGRTHYFAFGGCHRFQAYDRLSQEDTSKEMLVKSRIIPATKKTLELYLGSSVEVMFEEIEKEKK